MVVIAIHYLAFNGVVVGGWMGNCNGGGGGNESKRERLIKLKCCGSVFEQQFWR